MSKHKIKIIFIFILSLAGVTLYGNYKVFRGHIFAETNENITRSEAENSLIEASGATNVEKKEEQPTNQEIGTELDTDWEIGTIADYFEKKGNKIS